MDVFSFGMLCFWVLFEKYLSGITILPQESHWAEQYIQDKGERYLSKRILNDLKQEDNLVVLARQLVMAERDLDDDKKQALERFFNISLACNPDLREADLNQSFCCLITDQ